MKLPNLALALIIILACTACGKKVEVASNAIAPSSPEIGRWGATDGSTLYFADDNFTFTVRGQKPVTGSYSAASGVIKMAFPSGEIVATLTNPEGPLMVNNQSFNKG